MLPYYASETENFLNWCVVGVSKASELTKFRLNWRERKTTDCPIKPNLSEINQTQKNNHLQLKIRVSAVRFRP
jgi:hypothetical protein